MDNDRQFMVDKHYADLRIKLGAKKSQQAGKLHQINMTKTINDVESLPSDNMEDQWAAINNYDFEQWRQEEKNKKREYQEKRQHVKTILDQQVAQRRADKERIQKYEANMDRVTLHQAKKELDREKQERKEFKKKIELQKVQRDIMLMQAKEKRMREVQKGRKDEIKEVEVLQKELQDEESKKRDVKKLQREAALKVIAQNEEDRKVRLAEKEVEKQKQIRIVEEFNRM